MEYIDDDKIAFRVWQKSFLKMDDNGERMFGVR